MAKHKEECDCLFCTSKCPECGSTAISVRFNMKWEYDNEDLNMIHISQNENSIEVDCEDCGETFELGEYGFGDDKRLLPLRKVLLKELDLPRMIVIAIDEKGDFSRKQCTFTSAPLEKKEANL